MYYNFTFLLFYFQFSCKWNFQKYDRYIYSFFFFVHRIEFIDFNVISDFIFFCGAENFFTAHSSKVAAKWPMLKSWDIIFWWRKRKGTKKISNQVGKKHEVRHQFFRVHLSHRSVFVSELASLFFLSIYV